jgi:hypothetical protein
MQRLVVLLLGSGWLLHLFGYDFDVLLQQIRNFGGGEKTEYF